MEVMMSSPIQTCAEMEKDRAAADLLKYQESERKKLIRKLELARPHVGMIPQSLIQVNPNADLGATALVQLSKRQSKKNRKLLREHIENPEIKLEVARQIVDMITHPSIPDYSMITESSIQEFSNIELGTTANVQSHEHKSTKKLLGEHIENLESKLEVARQNVDVMTQSSIQDNANIDLGTAATVEPSKPQKRRKRKLPREDTENPESKPEVPRQNDDDIIQSESSILKREGYMEIDEVEMGSSRTISGDVKSGSEREEYTEIVNDMRGSSRNATVDVKPSSRSEEQKEVGNRAIGAHNAKTTMLKGEQNMNIAISETVSSGTAIIDAGSKREEYMVSASGETALGTFATPDAKMVSKGEEHPEVANGEMGSNMPTNVHVDGTIEKKKKKKSRRKEPTLGENLNSQQLEDVEVANGEMGSNMPKNVHVDSTIEKKKKKKSRKKEPTLGENLNPQQLEDMGVANGEMGSNMPKNVHVDGTIEKKKKKKSRRKEPTLGENLNPPQLEDMEVANGEMGSNMPKNVHVDGTIEKKKKKKSRIKEPTLGENLNPPQLEDMEVANGEMGSNMPKNVHVDGTIEKKKKKKSRRKEPTLGENLNPQQLEDMEVATGEMDSGTTETDNTVSKKRKRQMLENKNPASGDILGTSVCIQDTVLAKKGLSSTKILEPTSGQPVSCKTVTPDANMSKGKEQTKVANGEIDSSEPKREERKSKKLNKKAAKGEILTTSENTQDLVIAKKDAGTNKVLEATSTGSKREDTMEILNGEKSLRTTSLDASVGCTGVVNSEMGSSGTITIVENTGSRETSTLDAKTVSKVEECTSISRKKEKKKKKKGDAGLQAIDVIPHIPTSEKKLLVFDVNGLLADIVSPAPKDARADIYIPRRAIFKRPFLDDFLRFCFEKFHVAIWSSRTKKVLDPVVNYLLGGFKNKLLFIWNASNCSHTGMSTLEDNYKCIVFKDLRKIWEKNGPCNSWVKGTYNDSNTLLLDDSPYKALLNPKHNGIFPESYSYKNKHDNFLGPTGVLRTYLEGVAATDNLKMYVEQHPFGQRFIDEKDPHWSFYKRVLKGQHTSLTN